MSLDSGAALLAILLGFGTIAGVFWKLARWGWRQDRAIFDLQREVARLKREDAKKTMQLAEMKWAGKVMIFRRRARHAEVPILPAPYDEDPES